MVEHKKNQRAVLHRFKVDQNPIQLLPRLNFAAYSGRGGVMVSALDLRSEGRVVSLDRKLDSTLSLSTQVYKMGTGDILLGGNPAID